MLAPRRSNACGQSVPSRTAVGPLKYASGTFRPEWQPTEKIKLLLKFVALAATSVAYTLFASLGKNRLCAKCELSEFRLRAGAGAKKLARKSAAVQLSLISVVGGG